jgi:hypothetical protein
LDGTTFALLEADMIEASRALEPAEIRERIKTTFSNSYLTLLSIIQGTALATLFLKVDYLVGRQSFHAPQLVMAIGILLAIILLWNQYQMGVSLYYWHSSLYDAFIPFSFGIVEFSAILGLENGGMILLIAFGSFFALGVFAFEHQYLQLRRCSAPDHFVRKLTRGFRALDATSCAVSAGVFFVAALTISHLQRPTADLTAGWVLIAVSIGQAAREVYFWRVALHRLSSGA